MRLRNRLIIGTAIVTAFSVAIIALPNPTDQRAEAAPLISNIYISPVKAAQLAVQADHWATYLEQVAADSLAEAARLHVRYQELLAAEAKTAADRAEAEFQGLLEQFETLQGEDAAIQHQRVEEARIAEELAAEAARQDELDAQAAREAAEVAARAAELSAQNEAAEKAARIAAEQEAQRRAAEEAAIAAGQASPEHAAPAVVDTPSPYAYSNYVANRGNQPAVDACTGGLTYGEEVSAWLGRDYYPIHNHCNGNPILSLKNGDLVEIQGVGIFRVVDSTDVRQGDRADIILGVGGSILLQTCYKEGNKMRVVGLVPA
jgi:hypothetical protein